MTNRPRPRLLVREALTGHSLPALWQLLTFSQYSSIPKKALTSVCVCTGILLIGIHNIMLLIPAIDLKDGRCVRLRQGDLDDATIFSDDPAAMATQWLEQGARRLHLFDQFGRAACREGVGQTV